MAQRIGAGGELMVIEVGVRPEIYPPSNASMSASVSRWNAALPHLPDDQGIRIAAHERGQVERDDSPCRPLPRRNVEPPVGVGLGGGEPRGNCRMVQSLPR